MTGTMDAQKQAEHHKKDPGCAAHCAMSGHHLATIPQDVATQAQGSQSAAPLWATGLPLESATLEGLTEPPSRA